METPRLPACLCGCIPKCCIWATTTAIKDHLQFWCSEVLNCHKNLHVSRHLIDSFHPHASLPRHPRQYALLLSFMFISWSWWQQDCCLPHLCHHFHLLYHYHLFFFLLFVCASSLILTSLSSTYCINGEHSVVGSVLPGILCHQSYILIHLWIKLYHRQHLWNFCTLDIAVLVISSSPCFWSTQFWCSRTISRCCCFLHCAISRPHFKCSASSSSPQCWWGR